MSYPGNASLSAAVKDRVMSTFQQTLALYRQGRRDEVLSGCNLMLQMDPMFEPARKLLDKTNNPSLPIDVERLAGSGATIDQARQAMAGRDFQRVIQITTDILTEDLMNDDARVLGDEAREKLEAAPFIDQFVRKGDQQIAAGNFAGAKAELEKAKALDAAHPDVQRIGREIIAREGMAAPSAPPVSAGFSFDASPSFIVDDASKNQASGRGAAQASDFGFTFEEDKGSADGGFANFSFDAPSPAAPPAAGFSFDAPSPSPSPAAPPPPAPAAPPATGGFDFATASITTTPEDQRKIDQYLTDGDRAFEGGDYQQAIDTWSRIFLIDVTNDAASERIERAKSRRREVEDRVETLLASAVASFEKKDKNRARSEFAEVLRMDPNNTTAQDFMERLSDTAVEGGAFGTSTNYIPPPDEKPLNLDYLDDESSAYSDVLTPPAPGQARPSVIDEDEEEEEVAPKKGAKKAPAKAKATAPSERKFPMGAIVGVLAILVLAAGGWFYWTRFMNKPEVDPAATQAIFTRATNLANQGQFEQAIKVLQNVQTSDPEHDRALEMIADLQKKKSTAAQLVDGKPVEQFFSEHMTAAQTAFDAHDYGTAKVEWEQAQRAKPLPPDAKANYDTATQQVAKLDAAKALMQERKYTEALLNLQTLHDQDPANVTILKTISNAHFNLGATALQEERTQDAAKEFDEVLKIAPDDELAHRSRELAQRYDDRPKDLLYRIYVKYLPLR